MLLVPSSYVNFLFCICAQVQLLTLLVRLEEVPGKQVRDVYKLLLDDSYAIRHAAAELVADMLEESGRRHLGQARPLVICYLLLHLYLQIHKLNSSNVMLHAK